MSLPKLPMPTWQVRIDGNVYEADTPTLRAWIQEGRVLPTDPVKFGNGEWMPVSEAPQFRVAPPSPLPAPPPMSPSVAMKPSLPFTPPPFLTAGLNFRDPVVFSQPVELMMGLISSGLILPIVIAPVARSMDLNGVVTVHFVLEFMLGKVLVTLLAIGIAIAVSPRRGYFVIPGLLIIGLGFYHLFLVLDPNGVALFSELFPFLNLKISRPGAVRGSFYWPLFGGLIAVGVFMIQTSLIRVPDEGLLLAEQPLRYVGLWGRSVAAFVDLLWLVAGGISLTISLLTFVVLYGERLSNVVRGGLFLGSIGLSVLLGLLAGVRSQATYAGTPGQMSRRTVILDANDRRKVSPGRIYLRALASLLSFLPLGLGFFWMAFDKKKQTWHDKLAGTVMVHLD